jgi:hypothetical protein
VKTPVLNFLHTNRLNSQEIDSNLLVRLKWGSFSLEIDARELQNPLR